MGKQQSEAYEGMLGAIKCVQAIQNAQIQQHSSRKEGEEDEQKCLATAAAEGRSENPKGLEREDPPYWQIYRSGHPLRAAVSNMECSQDAVHARQADPLGSAQDS